MNELKGYRYINLLVNLWKSLYSNFYFTFEFQKGSTKRFFSSKYFAQQIKKSTLTSAEIIGKHTDSGANTGLYLGGGRRKTNPPPRGLESLLFFIYPMEGGETVSLFWQTLFQAVKDKNSSFIRVLFIASSSLQFLQY